MSAVRTPQRTVTGFTDSTPLLASPDQLRARADKDGFLYFKKYLPAEPLLELRRQILEILDRYGWIKKGTNLMDGIGDLEAIAKSEATDKNFSRVSAGWDAYRDVQYLELFHAIPHHPKLIALYEKLFDGPVFPHPRNIARVLLPSPGFAPTPPHQDYIYIQGTHKFWTCWFPLGDCPIELGGLSVLRGSHKERVLDVKRAKGAGGFESWLCDLDYEWVQGDYECGDLITFPSHMVHKGLPNRRPGHIRLSCDNRYQSANDEIEGQSLRPHGDIATWDEVYRGWKSDKLKYYWKSKTLKPSPWDASILVGKERIC